MEVVSLLDADIGEGSYFGVEGVVLSVRSIEVLSGELVRSEVSKNMFKHVHGEEIRVGPGGGLEEDTDINVGHFVVSHEEGGGSEEGFFCVFDWVGGLGGELGESL